MSEPRIGDDIRVPEVRLVGPRGDQLGVVRIEVARKMAREAGLDLVEVSPHSAPPVVKIMDYGKYKYESAQKAKETRRNQSNSTLKEIRFRLKIDDHDYETKRRRAESFLRGGDKVKALILFRGREQSRPELGSKLLKRFAADIGAHGNIESMPQVDGRSMTMVISPFRHRDSRAEEKQQEDKPVFSTAAEPAAESVPKPKSEPGSPETETGKANRPASRAQRPELDPDRM